MPVESVGGPNLQGFAERSLLVKPRDWEITVSLSHNAYMDDQSGGSLMTRVRGVGANFQKHINKLIFQALNGGDGTTYGSCYNGFEYFDTLHVDKGASYQTAQSNLKTLSLTLDNFQTNLNAARAFVDDQGELTEFDYNLLIVPPAYEYVAAQICTNPQAYDTANRENNPYSGRFDFLVSGHMDSTAWIIAAVGETSKPIYLAMREQPNLQAAGFDEKAADGGRYWFKFYARYNVFYGDWRLALLGAT
jgi:phage major head subunit gpT-like protein